jgi:hypothetical protein
MTRKLILMMLVAASSLFAASEAFARGDNLPVGSGSDFSVGRGDGFSDKSEFGHVYNGKESISSDQILDLSTNTSGSMSIAADQAERNGNTARTVNAFKKAIDLNPEDYETRIKFATYLENKLRKQKNPNAKLFNYIVSQWLLVYKKDLFDDEKQLSLSHLQGLCGRAPQPYQTIKGYLKKVTYPEDGSVKVVLGGHTE